MPKTYEVLERSFINGRLYEKGESVTLEIDSPGGNLKQLGGGAGSAPVAAQPSAGQSGGATPEFIAKHNGGGHYIILAKDGNRVGTFTGGKDEAKAEADRLNAGGAPVAAQPPQPAVPPADLVAQQGIENDNIKKDADGNPLPDA